MNLSTIPVTGLPVAESPGASERDAEALMLEVQTLVLRDFDEQLRQAAEQIRFLGGIKKRYREAVSTVQNFLTQNPDTSRKDGKRLVHATFAQMSELFGALKTYDYDLDSLSYDEKGLRLPVNGDRTGLDDPDGDGKTWAPTGPEGTDTRDLAVYFAAGASRPAAEQAELAGLAGDDDNRLPFYHGHTGNFTEKGEPLFAVYVEQIEALMQQLRDKLAGVEQESEQISLKLNQLMAQRKAALDGAGQLILKMDQVRGYALGRMG